MLRERDGAPGAETDPVVRLILRTFHPFAFAKGHRLQIVGPRLIRKSLTLSRSAPAFEASPGRRTLIGAPGLAFKENFREWAAKVRREREVRFFFLKVP